MARRKHSSIDMLDTAVKSTVEEMILSAQFTYKDISEYIRDTCGTNISQSAICRYAKGLCANMAAIHMAQENFKAIMAEQAKYPELDSVSGIGLIASNLMMSAVRSLSEEDLKNSDPLKIIKQASELMRAVSYKKSLDIKNKEITEIGYDATKEKFFEALEKDNPELYTQLAEYIEQRKEELRE